MRQQIQSLKTQLREQEEHTRLQTERQQTFASAFETIKQLLFRRRGHQYEIGVEELATELESILTAESEPKMKTSNEYEKVIKEQDGKIQELRDRLLESTQNNIHAIFNTELSSQEVLAREVANLRTEVRSIEHTRQEALACAREERLEALVKNYERLATEYKNKEEIIRLLQTGQQATNDYFL